MTTSTIRASHGARRAGPGVPLRPARAGSPRRAGPVRAVRRRHGAPADAGVRGDWHARMASTASRMVRRPEPGRRPPEARAATPLADVPRLRGGLRVAVGRAASLDSPRRSRTPCLKRAQEGRARAMLRCRGPLHGRVPTVAETRRVHRRRDLRHPRRGRAELPPRVAGRETDGRRGSRARKRRGGGPASATSSTTTTPSSITSPPTSAANSRPGRWSSTSRSRSSRSPRCGSPPDRKFGERTLTPLPDRLWNLATAFYYKCGGKPWRLSTARDGVCYIGLAFRRTQDRGKPPAARRRCSSRTATGWCSWANTARGTRPKQPVPPSRSQPKAPGRRARTYRRPRREPAERGLFAFTVHDRRRGVRRLQGGLPGGGQVSSASGSASIGTGRAFSAPGRCRSCGARSGG